VAAAGVMAHIYSAGLAAWDEKGDVERRFGSEWRGYRAQVRAWIPRWRPWHLSLVDGEAPCAKLYVSETCGPCSEVKRWFESHGAIGLEVVAAEEYPGGELMRVTYRASVETKPETGVAARDWNTFILVGRWWDLRRVYRESAGFCSCWRMRRERDQGRLQFC